MLSTMLEEFQRWLQIHYILGAVFIALLLWWRSRLERARLNHFWQRECTGRLWKRRFPHSDKREIRAFLSILTDSFGFAPSDRLCFAPEDTIWTIYTTVYPDGYMLKGIIPRADDLEMESFAEGILKRYSIDLMSRHDDITLGDLFDLAQTPRLQSPPPHRGAEL
jgi:hypothetical protein